ncbi:MAG: IS66 family transposase [Bacteroidales bacterium]|nr:IS66 family transposase [Bacteroidales bacterium]
MKTLILELQEQNKKLQQQITSLQEQVELLKNGRKSKTSSTPPSHDYSRSNQRSLRKQSNRKTGGQIGHEGTTLHMKEIPDEIVEYRPDYCNQCGAILNSEEYKMVSRKQEIVLPPVVPKYIEHRSYTCTCGVCGGITTGESPEYLKANVQYGPPIAALVGYLSVRQYLPYKRIAEFMNSFFTLPISEGTIDNMIAGLTRKAEPIYREIKSRVEQSSVVGGDETGIKINGKKAWLWTFQTQFLTFLVASMTRGYETISNVFQNGFPISVYVSDCLPAQLKIQTLAKQICISHLLRELNNFIDVFNCGWSEKLKQLFQEAILLKSELHPDDYLSPNEKVNSIRKRLDRLLDEPSFDKHKKVQTFIKRLNKHNGSILTFLYHQKVPPDNNGSERSIRNAKVKMKVSGGFKSYEGAYRFAVLRSYIDTTVKNSQDVFNALCLLAMSPAAE